MGAVLRASLVLIALVLGCSKPAPKPAPTQRPRLVTDAELAELETRLLTGIVAARTPPCPRPVVHGSPVPGPAAAKMLAVVELRPELAACVGALDTGPATPRVLVDERHAHVRELEARCGTELAALVHAAVVHEDGCSPYRVGERATGKLVPAIRVGQLLGVRARRLADEGDPEAALWLLVEVAAFAQDLERGRTGLLVRQIASVIALEAADQAMAIANTSSLSPASITAIATGIDALIASAPPVAATIQAEIDLFGLHDYLPRTKPASWVPPGGWPEGYPTEAAKPVSEAFLDAREEAAFMLVTNATQKLRFAEACPETATLRACHDGLAALAARTAHQPMAAMFSQVTGLGSATTDEARLGVRQALVEVLVEVAAVSYQQYPARGAGLLVRFGALRVHLEMLKFVATNRRCPTLAELDAAPFDALRAPAALGDRLRIDSVPTGYEIKSPAWFEGKRAPYAVRCPA